MPIRGWTPIDNYSKGAYVLQHANDDIKNDRDMVEYLVWSNPSQFGWASAALRADPDILSTALNSPFYWQPEPGMPSHCILRYADPQIRNDRSFILEHLSRIMHEVEFMGPDLRADKTVIAWAGAPYGAISTMLCEQEYVQFLKSVPATGLSAAYVDEHQSKVFDIHAKYLCNNAINNGRQICMQQRWNAMKETDRQEWCTQMWRSLQAKLPLFFRVAPVMREVLWPTSGLSESPHQGVASAKFGILNHKKSQMKSEISPTEAVASKNSEFPNFAKNGFWQTSE